MIRTLWCAALAAWLAAGPAWSQAMLDPPDTRYFVSQGSWGQKYADQWGLHRVGFDASPQSAWRLVKRDAKPVVVALIDTGLDWIHRNIDLENIWRNPKEIADNGVDDDKNGHVDDVIGWDFFERDNKPWDYDGHGTFITGLIAGSWKDKDGIAGINPFARLMILKAVKISAIRERLTWRRQLRMRPTTAPASSTSASATRGLRRSCRPPSITPIPRASSSWSPPATRASSSRITGLPARTRY
jgi:hypothetical protein